MIIIGEKLNGAIPSVRTALDERDDQFLINLALNQVRYGADYLDIAPSGNPEQEFEDMTYLISLVQSVTKVPLCIDSPNPEVLIRVLQSGLVLKNGMINSASLERDKCRILFPEIADSGWKVIGLTCDNSGIPQTSAARTVLAQQILDLAVQYRVPLGNVLIDPGVLSVTVAPDSMREFIESIRQIHALSPEIQVVGALSNISYQMPARKYINQAFLCYALEAGINAAIIDPTNRDFRSMIYACEVLLGNDRGGRKYNRAYRNGLVGTASVRMEDKK